jgi:hypothetical protein
MCLTFKSFLLFKLSSKLGNQKLSAKLSSNNKKSPCVAKTILYFLQTVEMRITIKLEKHRL